jgi:biofilm PGA synthesis N-glycosyltransferase PgaC
MATVFWTSCVLVAYVYAGYPLLLACWARLFPRPVRAQASEAPVPRVSIVIAARNEGSRLRERIDNLLQCSYPAERRHIVIVSDGSTDATPAVLASFGSAIEPVFVEACGKALALNAGVARADGDVVIFADARQTFAPDALRELVAPFEDPRVGAVTGELLLESEVPGPRAAVQSTIADGVGLYWRYEKSIRRNESAVASTLGATGAIYAIRRSLWRPLPAGTILDDVLAPMRAVLAGYRTVFSGRARAFDRIGPDVAAEARRKVRTLAGNYQLLWLEPGLLLPWRNPVWIQFVSHKLGRLLVPYGLLGLMVSSVALAAGSPVYAAALGCQCMFYLLAGYGGWKSSTDSTRRVLPDTATGDLPSPLARVARLAFTFSVMNYSAVAGLAAVLARKKVWR